MNKKILYFFLFLMLIYIPNSSNAFYKDVSRDYWAYHDIYYLTQKKVIKEYNGNFHSHDTITRLDAAVMMQRAMKLHSPTQPNKIPSDMKSYSRGYQEVLTLLDKGIFSLNGTKFEPSKPLTRKDMAKALSIAFQYKGKNQSTFKDVAKSNSYYPYIDSLVYNKVTTGYADETFRPNESVNRAQFAAFISRIYSQPLQFTVKQNGKVLHTVNNAEHAIQLALNYPKATVHPVSNHMNQYQPYTGQLPNTGIRNGVLIYNGAEQNTNFGSDYFKPYLTPLYKNNGDTLFDTFIILGRSYPNGEFGPHPKNHSNYNEWLWYIQQTFATYGVLSGLNESSKQLNKKTNVYISIPYPKRNETIVGIDEKKYKNTIQEREKMVNWYLNEVEKTWKSKGYTHLELKGYYWFSETLGYPQDEQLVESVSKIIHQKKKRFIYSPHATSTKFELWNELGFDGAYLQPNTFRLKFSKKETEIRLHRAFLNAQIQGSGINIEIDQLGTLQIDQGIHNFKQYIEMTHRYQLLGRSLIFYQGIGMVDRMTKFPQPTYKEAYEELSTLAY